MRTSARTKLTGAICGFIVFAIGVVWLIESGPKPFATLFVIVGAIFAVSMLASLWNYRLGKSDKTR
jgi:hypothetical protein